MYRSNASNVAVEARIEIRKRAYRAAIMMSLTSLAASVYTLIDGSGPVFEGGEVYRVIGPGWGGALLSVAVIFIGALGLRNEGRAPGYYLLICSTAGVLVGGAFPVIVLMALVAVASVVVIFSAERQLPKVASGRF